MTIDPKAGPDAEIISLADFRDGAEPSVRVIRAPTCWCLLMIDEKNRTVTCKRCGKVYEAFEALLYLCKAWTRGAARREATKSEVAKLQARRDELRLEIKTLKAQKKRAGEP